MPQNLNLQTEFGQTSEKTENHKPCHKPGSSSGVVADILKRPSTDLQSQMSLLEAYIRDMRNNTELQQVTSAVQKFYADPERGATRKQLFPLETIISHSNLTDAERIAKAEVLLGRQITDEQKQALLDAHTYCHKHGGIFGMNTAEKIVWSRKLHQASFSTDEIWIIGDSGLGGSFGNAFSKIFSLAGANILTYTGAGVLEPQVGPYYYILALVLYGLAFGSATYRGSHASTADANAAHTSLNIGGAIGIALSSIGINNKLLDIERVGSMSGYQEIASYLASMELPAHTVILLLNILILNYGDRIISNARQTWNN